MKRTFILLIIPLIIVLTGFLFGIQIARVAAHNKTASTVTSISVSKSQETFDAFSQSVSSWESNFTKPGWVRLNYIERTPTSEILADSPDAQFPKNASVEIWFHYNDNRAVDQEIDFFVMDGKRLLSSIIYRKEYRGLSEKFAPQSQQPYTPSLTFYLTVVTPILAAEEGAQMNVSQTNSVLNHKEVVQYSLTQIFPVGMSQKMGYGENVTGTRNIVTVDSNTGAVMGIKNYLLDKNLDAQLNHEITDVNVESFSSLPVEVQWYFDHFDQLDWELYFTEFQVQQ